MSGILKKAYNYLKTPSPFEQLPGSSSEQDAQRASPPGADDVVTRPTGTASDTSRDQAGAAAARADGQQARAATPTPRIERPSAATLPITSEPAVPHSARPGAWLAPPGEGHSRPAGPLVRRLGHYTH